MTSHERRDPYLVLGVPRQASADEIARAYRRAARVSHPDSGGVGSAEQFQAVSDAYDELRDPGRRAVYDRSHPLARPADRREPAVRYLAPGSQHLVLGRRAPPAAACPQRSAAVTERQRGNIEEVLRIALSLLLSGR